ncbi:MAG: hypothetical protein H6949_05820 [Zoogloeaceae bacterium]|nr:hypothetical protein [Zoogloeaceae bacterium]
MRSTVDLLVERHPAGWPHRRAARQQRQRIDVGACQPDRLPGAADSGCGQQVLDAQDLGALPDNCCAFSNRHGAPADDTRQMPGAAGAQVPGIGCTPLRPVRRCRRCTTLQTSTTVR